MRILISGIGGFVGSHVLSYLLEKTDWEIVCLVRMSRAGNLNRLKSILEGYNVPKRVSIVRHDLMDSLDSIHRHIGQVDFIVHMAADSHVDDSILRPTEVFINNAVSTANILRYADKYQSVKKFLYYSTDEVYGDADDGYEFVEDDMLNPRNPYSAGKAAGEMITNAYRETYGLPTLIMRTENMFGEMQDPEKFVPKIVGHILKGESVPIHYTGDTIVTYGRRHWLYAKNSASAVLFMLQNNKDIQRINVGSEVELNNLEMAQAVARIMGKNLNYTATPAHSIRPGYDKRYSIDYNL
jgi:dTDP-glucose 4,6-dehydratase